VVNVNNRKKVLLDGVRDALGFLRLVNGLTVMRAIQARRVGHFRRSALLGEGSKESPAM